MGIDKIHTNMSSSSKPSFAALVLNVSLSTLALLCFMSVIANVCFESSYLGQWQARQEFPQVQALACDCPTESEKQ